MAEASRQQLLTSVKDLLTSKAYSDLKITCGPDVYEVHKAIVCPRAAFFHRAVNFGVGKEAAEGVIDLPEDEPEIVRLLVQYLYEGEYDPMFPADSRANPTAVAAGMAQPNWHDCRGRGEKCTEHIKQCAPHSCDIDPQNSCRVYYNARHVCDHHYCSKECNTDCSKFVCKICIPPIPVIDGPATQIVTHAKIYEIADKYGVVGLKKLSKEKFKSACAQFKDDPIFSVAAHHVFATTPDEDKGLRDIVSRTISDHMAMIKRPEIEELLTEVNGLAFGLLRGKAEEHDWY